MMPGKMSPLPQPWATAGDSGDFFIGVDKSACSGNTRQSGTQMICRARSPSLRPLPRREPVNTPTSLTRVGGTMADSLGGALGAMIAQHGGHLALPSITTPNRSIRFIAQNLGGYSELVFSPSADDDPMSGLGRVNEHAGGVSARRDTSPRLSPMRLSLYFPGVASTSLTSSRFCCLVMLAQR